MAETASFSAEVLDEDDHGFLCSVSREGESLGEVDVDWPTTETAFISGVGEGKAINNGSLAPASIAVAAIIHIRHPEITHFFDFNNTELPLQ